MNGCLAVGVGRHDKVNGIALGLKLDILPSDPQGLGVFPLRRCWHNADVCGFAWRIVALLLGFGLVVDGERVGALIGQPAGLYAEQPVARDAEVGSANRDGDLESICGVVFASGDFHSVCDDLVAIPGVAALALRGRVLVGVDAEDAGSGACREAVALYRDVLSKC